MRARPAIAIPVCVSLFLLFWWFAPDRPGDPRRGRELFARGVDVEGRELVGILGGEVPLAGKAVACVGCHGPGGRGRAEGGLRAPDLRELAGADPDRLARALEDGVGLDGRRLSPVMPRLRFTGTQRADLLAYLRAPVAEPGVAEDRVRIGTLLPLAGPGAEGTARTRAILEAAFREVNDRGGIYRRRLELVVADAADPEGASRLDRETFALVAGELPPPGADLPAVGPAALPAEADERRFFLFPGHADQGRLAVAHLARREDAASRRILLVHRDDGPGRRFADGVRRELSRRRLPAPRVHVGPFEPGLLDGVDLVLLGGSAEDLAALETALAGRAIEAIAPGHLIRPIAGPIRFVHPWRLDEAPGPGEAAFVAFLQRNRVPPGKLAVAIQAFTAARLLVEGLRRAGAEPTRAGLVEALASIRDLETGVTPPLSFGPGRRVGIAGAHLARWEPGAGRPVADGDWVELR